MGTVATKPAIGDTVTVTDYADKRVYRGTVIEALDSQFIYHVTHIDNEPNPMRPGNRWEKFCFYKDKHRDWIIKVSAKPLPTLIRHQSF